MAMETSFQSSRVPRLARVGVLALSAWLSCVACAETIHWGSGIGGINLTSGGAALNGSFTFELGVFSDGFKPEEHAVGEWLANWHALRDQSATYDVPTSSFNGSYNATSNSVELPAGAQVYIFGHDKLAGAAEWILVTNDSRDGNAADDWTLPAFSSFPNPFGDRNWYINAGCGAVLGAVNTGGLRMRTAAVEVQGSVPQSFADWASGHGVGSGSQAEDPDHDGLNNFQEYAFGKAPGTSDANGVFVQSSVMIGSVKFATLTVPRNAMANVRYLGEFSTDLNNWTAGAVRLAETPVSITWRAALPISTTPRGFFRVRLTSP